MATRVSQALPRDLRFEPTPIAGLVRFLDEKVDLTVDGAAVDRPATRWSRGVRSAPRGGGSGARQGPHESPDV